MTRPQSSLLVLSIPERTKHNTQHFLKFVIAYNHTVCYSIKRLLPITSCSHFTEIYGQKGKFLAFAGKPRKKNHRFLMDAFFLERNTDLALVSCAHLFASQTIKKATMFTHYNWKAMERAC